MKTLLFALMNLVVVIGISQPALYEETFETDVLSAGAPPPGFEIGIANEAFQIIGNGQSTEWSAINYRLHDETDMQTQIDASSSPKLYIRAKGDGSPRLRVDFQDATGYMTNLEPVDVVLNDDFVIYELDYNGHLTDGAYGGPCTDAPCIVDASVIEGLLMFVNPGQGGYNGVIDIDWISIGSPAGGAVLTIEHDIRYNQVTYLTGRKKTISIAANSPIEDLKYRIFEEGGESPIMTGEVSGNFVWSPSQEYFATVNVSEIDQPGNYEFKTETESITFNVSDAGYNQLCKASLKYYYYNRASQELTSEYAGPWARPLGHPDDEVLVHASAASADRPTGTIISSPKGWYDAGDYNKYIVNSGISTYTLLAAYEHYADYYQKLNIHIPESDNNLPDLLDEIIWNLDWMLSMQDPADGGVYHKLTGLNFSGVVMPHQYNLNRYVVQKTTAAALNFAAVTAVAARIFREFDEIKPGYSDELIAASESAYNWAKTNSIVFYSQPSNVRTGEYGDGNVVDEFAWAASELFISTRNSTYLSDINEGQIGNGVAFWQYTAPLALISLTHHADDLGSDIDTEVIKNKLLQTANQLKGTVNQSAMRVAMGLSNGDFSWGSNGHAGNQIMMLIRAYEIANDESFLDAAYTAMDYLLGRNGTGYSYITGYGDRSPMRPHHRASQADNFSVPVPGMVVGGPNPGQQDGCANYIGNEPAVSYVDSWCSYASNEVTINWNAPLAYSINALHYYQNGEATSTQDISDDRLEVLEVIPNPGNNTVYIPQIKVGSNQQLQIISQSGDLMLDDRKLSTQYLDVSNLPAGFYIYRLIEKDKTYTTKWLKI